MKTALSTLLLAGLFLAGILIPELVASQSNGVIRGDIVTKEFFNGIMDKSASTCPGKAFYTRAKFLRVIREYPEFARSGSLNDSKREIAAFFAHVTYETDHMCHIEEINGRKNSDNYCDRRSTKYPCAPNKSYYGRGPFQIVYNYNYGAAGRSLGLDLLGNPDMVANDPVISFRTALWFWMENVHSVYTSGEGFGATISAFNGMECRDNEVSSHVAYYIDYCNQFRVQPGDNLLCYTPISLPRVTNTKRVTGAAIYNNLVLENFGLYLTNKKNV